eukprot:gene6729-9222_t
MMKFIIVTIFAIIVSVNGFRTGNAGKFLTSTRQNLFGNSPPPSNNTPAEKKDGGMFGGMGNLMEGMKKAQEIAKLSEQLNKELAATVVQGTDPSGQVTCTFSGLGMPVSIKISDSLLSQGSEAVSIASTQAMVDTHAKTQQEMMNRLKDIYGRMGVPQQ